MAFASKLGFNSTWSFYYTEEYVFIDYLKGSRSWLQGSGWASSIEFDSYMNGRAGGYVDDFLPNLPAGRSVFTIVRDLTSTIYAAPPPVNVNAVRTFRQGTFFVTWSGSANVTVNANFGSGVTVTNPSANRIQIATGTTGLFYLQINVANDTGAPITVNNLKVFHSSDEADMNAGKVINQVSLQKFKGCKNLRALDLVATMGWGTTFGDFVRPLTDFVGVGDLPSQASFNWKNVPAVVLGKMAAEISAYNNGDPCDIWIPVPVRMNQAAWAAYVQGVHDNHPVGKLKVEAGNEIWNSLAAFSRQGYWYNQVYIRGAESGGDGNQRPVWNGGGVQYPMPYIVEGSLGSYIYKAAGSGTSTTTDNARLYNPSAASLEGGLNIALPASTQLRTAKLYLMGFTTAEDAQAAAFALECTLSDNSFSLNINYTLTSIGNDNFLVADLTYRAGSSGQTLNALWKMKNYSGTGTIRAVFFGAAWVSAGGATGAATISGSISVNSSAVDLTALGGADYLINRAGETPNNGHRKTGGGSTISVTEFDPSGIYTLDHEDKSTRPFSATDATPTVTSTGVVIPEWQIAQCMMTHQAVDRWVTAEAIYGRPRVLRVISGQQGYQAFAAYSLDTKTTKLGAEDTVAKKMDIFSVGNYVKLGTSARGSELRSDMLMAEKLYNNVNAMQIYYDRIKAYIDASLVTGLQDTVADLAVRGATQAQLMSYECWRHTNTLIIDDTYGVRSLFTVDLANNALTYNPQTNTQFSGYTRDEMFDTGDVVKFTNIAHVDTVPEGETGSGYKPDGYHIYYAQFPTVDLVDNQLYVRRLSTDKLTLHKSLADATAGANVINLKAASDVRGANVTRLRQLEDLQRNFAESEMARKLFIYWWNVTVRPYFAEVSLYTQAGSWNDGFGASWGLVQNSMVADHPAAVQARKMNNIGVTCAQML